MAKAAYVQSSFLGGEWGPFAQGRFDREDYRTAMNRCFNVVPVEEGAAARRPGTRWLATTRNGLPAVLKEFSFNAAASYNMEFSPGHLRFFSGYHLVLEAGERLILSISPTSPAVVQTGDEHGWATGDQVEFVLTQTELVPLAMSLFGKQFLITVLDDFSFSLADPVTGAPFDGTGVGPLPASIGVYRVQDFVTPYVESQLQSIRTVQDQKNVLVLEEGVKPYSLNVVTPPAGTDYATFNWGAAVFLDGPYLDPPVDGSTVTPAGLISPVSLAFSGGGDFVPFTQDDLGRHVRLLSEPQDWSSATAYTEGDVVKYDNAYWSALEATTGDQPGLELETWGINPSAAIWTWGTITTITDANNVVVTLATDSEGIDGVPMAGGPLLYTHVIKAYRLGLYSEATGWPSCGTYHEGRFWLGGSAANRLDASMSNLTFRFSPTTKDGTVADNNAISYTFNSASLNTMRWMVATDDGVVCGTQESEWLVRASSNGDPLTPTSIQASSPTSFGSLDTEALSVGEAVLFVHKFARKVMEYVPNPQPGKYTGNNLSWKAKHLTTSGLTEIVYQKELAPVIWALVGDGTLIGCTYKREDPYGTQPVLFSGWHHHELGTERLVESIQTGPSMNGLLDGLMMVTNDPDTNVRWVELMTTLFDQDTPITGAWFADAAQPAFAAEIVVIGPTTYLRLWGFPHLEGVSVAVWAGGVDCGDFVVTGGKVDVPIDTTNNLLTSAYLAALTASSDQFEDFRTFAYRGLSGSLPEPAVSGIMRLAYTGGIAKPDEHAEINWDEHVTWLMKQGSGSTAGVRKFNTITGAQIQAVDAPTIYGGSGKAVSPTSARDDLDRLYMFADYGSNSGQVGRLDATTLLATLSTINIDHPWIAPRSMTVIYPGSARYLISLSTVVTGGVSLTLQTMNADTLIVSTDTVYGHGRAGGYICNGPFNEEVASVYFFGFGNPDPTSGDSRLPAVLSNYAVTEAGQTSGHVLWSILPEVIDAGWHHFSDFGELFHDETDGGVITFATIGAPRNWVATTSYPLYDVVRGSNGHDYGRITGGGGDGGNPTSSPTNWHDYGVPTYTNNTHFMMKFSATGLFQWKFQVPNIPLTTECGSRSRIQFQRFYWLADAVLGGGTNYLLYKVNTATGAVTTTSMQGCSGSAALSDDVTGSILIQGTYTQTTGPQALPPSPTSWTGDWSILPGLGLPPTENSYKLPVVVGKTFTSEGQIVRPIAPQEAGTVRGPALGATKRAHMFSCLMHRTQGLSYGTTYEHLRPAEFKTPGGRDYTKLQLFSGTLQGTLDDDYNFDSMFCWRVTRPYPATILAIEPNMQSQDR